MLSRSPSLQLLEGITLYAELMERFADFENEFSVIGDAAVLRALAPWGLRACEQENLRSESRPFSARDSRDSCASEL